MVRILILHGDSIDNPKYYLPKFYKRFPDFKKWDKQRIWKLQPAKIGHKLKALGKKDFDRIYYNTDQITWKELAPYTRMWPSAQIFGFSLDPNKKEKNSTSFQTKINELRKNI